MISSAAEKLWRDGSVAASLCVFIRPNQFKASEEQYSRSMAFPPLSLLTTLPSSSRLRYAA